MQSTASSGPGCEFPSYFCFPTYRQPHTEIYCITHTYPCPLPVNVGRGCVALPPDAHVDIEMLGVGAIPTSTKLDGAALWGKAMLRLPLLKRIELPAAVQFVESEKDQLQRLLESFSFF